MRLVEAGKIAKSKLSDTMRLVEAGKIVGQQRYSFFTRFVMAMIMMTYTNVQRTGAAVNI